MPIGTRAFVEGPHGAFTLADEAEGAVFVAGGVGITPVMSILRTMRDRGDRRPALLVYAAASLERMIFREELEALRGEMNLRIVRVLESPLDGWEEERGWVTDDLLDRLLPVETRSWHHFVCGPDPMMDVVESALLARGIPGDRLLSERFNIA